MADLLPTSTLSYDDWANKTLEELIEYSLESSPFRDFECPLRYAILPSAWIFITTVPTLPNGMPIRPENRPDSDLPVIAMLAAAGTFELFFVGHTIRVIARSQILSKAVKCYMLIELIAKFLFAISRFNRIICIINWYCVATDNYPFSGLMLNFIITACEFALELTIKLVAVAFCINRFFAVFFNGIYFTQAERLALPQCSILVIIPLIGYLMQIGTLTNKTTDYVCYGGTYFSPLNYLLMTFYSWKALLQYYWKDWIDIYAAPISAGLSILLDSLVLWKIRRLNTTINSTQRGNANIKLVLMMLITNLISLVTYLQRQILRVDIGITPSNYKQKILGQYYYVTLPQMIFRDLQTLCVLLFNLPPRQPKHQPPILSKQSASNGNIATIKVD
ncbi:unnamed protein product, partial [Mesorhabditis belari]|uniref:Uncharacterized protein n=1 Tax=Mesorhabditis belari TaxID=2138241 RepID=A0AAF3ETB5_9BILA